MKTIEIKFTTVLKIVLILILVLASIYIYNIVQGRYQMNKQIQISYKTSDYYFSTSVDITEIDKFPATINITAKNNNGTNYTTGNLIYTIGVNNSNYTVAAVGGNTRTLVGGSKQQETYAVTINKTGIDDSEKINLTFTVNKPYADTINKELTITAIPAYYGALVTNYTCPTSGVKWRVFHKDENGRYYLIADDYVPYSSLPTSTSGTALNKGSTEYRAYFTNILGNYTGSAWIKNNTNANAQKWLNKFLTTYPASTNNNIKTVAYMMDTTKWNGKFKGDKAEYVIGGPTLELFCDSYKKTHPDKYIEWECVTGSNGYSVKWNSSGTYAAIVQELTKDDFNKIYVDSDPVKAQNMWIASPSKNGANTLMCVSYTGQLRSELYYTRTIGFRPIVCLNSGVNIVSNGDGTYRIN